MQSMTSAVTAAARVAGMLTIAALVTGAPFVSTVAAAGPAAAAASAPNGCYYKFVPPNSWVEVCQTGSGGGGSGGGGTTSLKCYLNKMTPQEIQDLGLPPAPPGEEWEFIQCPALQIPIGNVILVSKTGGPPVTPQELLQMALGSITVPVLAPQTAPPLQRRALVGLPEWYWIAPGQWRPVTVTVAVGAVWATLTATPDQLTFDPGGGLGATSCAGPGVSYRKGASGQGACRFTYFTSSALQPGGAYQAAVTVTWRVTWTGSGGVGGVVNAGLQMPFPFTLRVAEGQALVTGP
jgi:hypothetical protein